MNSPKEEIAKLSAKIEYNNQLYYNDDNPKMSDYEWDIMYHQLKRLEDQNPDLVEPDSPTQRVGALSKEAYVIKYGEFIND